MSDDYEHESLYQTSKHGHKCIGPCNAPGVVSLNPRTQYMLRYNNTGICPIEPFYEDEIPNGSVLIGFDECDNAEMQNNESNKKIIEHIKKCKNDFIVPKKIFRAKMFASYYYGIQTIEDGIEWLENNQEEPYRTKERVFNHFMHAYGNGMVLADGRLLKFIRTIILKNIHYIIKNIGKYFYIDDNKITLIDPNDSVFGSKNTSGENMNKYLIELYIKAKFLNESDVSKFLSKLANQKNDIIRGQKASVVIMNNIIDYITKKIMISIKG